MTASGWAALLLAGLFEISFTTALKLEQNNKNWIWAFLICAIISFSFLSEAIKTIPIGTAYAIWTGIGAVGTTLIGMTLFKEPASAKRLSLLGLVIVLIIGLKVAP